MTYLEFKKSIGAKLQKKTSGLTWNELRSTLDLPYGRPCPEWTRRLEKEIGLRRVRGTGRALVWRVNVKVRRRRAVAPSS